jgi:hypothetical protein
MPPAFCNPPVGTEIHQGDERFERGIPVDLKERKERALPIGRWVGLLIVSKPKIVIEPAVVPLLG